MNNLELDALLAEFETDLALQDLAQNAYGASTALATDLEASVTP